MVVARVATEKTGGRSGDPEATSTMNTPRIRAAALVILLGCAMGPTALAQDRAGAGATITDKTLVAWVRLADADQRGVSPLSLQNLPGQFDAIVLGELRPGRWMAGSEMFRRTRDAAAQEADAVETAAPDRLVQIAASYRGREVTLFRDAKPYSTHTIAVDPASFSTRSLVLMGVRHWEIAGTEALRGSIEDARIYAEALDGPALAALRPDREGGPRPFAWWTFEEPDGSATAKDRMGTFRDGHIVGAGRIEGGALRLAGGYLLVGTDPPRTRDREPWPTYHFAALPEEGLARPYDANGCIYWKGKYHLMYIYQDPSRPHGGHCWGHAVSIDLVNWTILPPALRPEPGDPDVGIFSGNAFLNKDGVPMLCWFGVNAGVCVATAEPGDDDLIRWKKHPNNPIIPMPKPGEPGHGVYTVWDPYLWLEGGRYTCLLGGNSLPNGKDTLYAMTSDDLVKWTPVGPFYEHPDLSWTTPGEDCSCPDFFKLGDKRVLLCISHKVGGRAYVGRYEDGRFRPETHVRMNWPGAQFFAPETLEDGRGRRIMWAWVTDPRTITTQRATGSGVQSLPRVLTLADDGGLNIAPAEELQSLRRDPRGLADRAIPADGETTLEGIRGDCLELAVTLDPGSAREVGVKVRCAPDGAEETAIWYRPADGVLSIDMSRSTTRTDVVYTENPLDTGGIVLASDYKTPRETTEAPLKLRPGEPLRLRIFLDKPMLEVFANDRQCLTQQIFPDGADSLGVKLCAKGGTATARRVEAWDMAPAKFENRKTAARSDQAQ
jgi:sucrose-6-phosphate hydrolase SacC (GH32 family)